MMIMKFIKPQWFWPRWSIMTKMRLFDDEPDDFFAIHRSTLKLTAPRGLDAQDVLLLVVNTFKRSTAERMPYECNQSWYTCDILEYLFKSTAERVQPGPIYWQYISTASLRKATNPLSSTVLVDLELCKSLLWIDNWILCWGLRWINVESKSGM